jgi:hypothetical protein
MPVAGTSVEVDKANVKEALTSIEVLRRSQQ